MMPYNQPDLFGEKKSAPAPHLPNPQHVRNRFIEFLAQMRAAEVWPWDEDRVEFLRDTVWPQLYTKLADQAEVADWKAQMEAEAARLDKANGGVS